MTNPYPLALLTEYTPTKNWLEAKVGRAHAAYERLNKSVDDVLARLSSTQEVSQAVRALCETSYRLSLLQSDSVKLDNKTGVGYSVSDVRLRDVLDMTAPAQGHVNRSSITRLYRKLRANVHPDRIGHVNTGVTLDAIRSAYNAGSLDLLQVYALMLRVQTEDTEPDARKILSILERRTAMLQVTPSYDVLRSYVKHGPTAARVELSRLIFIRHRVIKAALSNVPS